RMDELDMLGTVVRDLHDTLMDFRARYGIGRAIAAPQIGVLKRLIYMNINGEATVLINPRYTFLSDERMELWDDCMSFPNLLVLLSRHRKCTVEYRDMNWNLETKDFEDGLSELIQHEYDHLDGILAVDRAIDHRSFRYRCLDTNDNVD
ncbi:MAG: peptide deformylase, partial [Candidatus Thorarchaeota archaeon]